LQRFLFFVYKFIFDIIKCIGVIKVKKKISCILALCLVIGCYIYNKENKTEGLRGVWIASVYNIDYPSQQGLREDDLKRELDLIIKNVKKINGNAIFFQVRPTADALYQSQIFPWSHWLSGKQGQGSDGNFDPLEYLIKEGKKEGIEIHAWLNPYKVTRGSVANPNYDLEKLDKNNPLLEQKELLIYANGEIYMDPGQEKSRQLVLQAVEELVVNYDIAGIHYDDYFYPEGEFADDLAYATYCKEQEAPMSKEQWRRENVNALIQETYLLIKELDKKVQFGVSPAGVWANRSAEMPYGSDTWLGTETYYRHYADSRLWVEKGWVDYIAPQIYWNVGYEGCDYEILVKWWKDICKDANVKLYVGQALYKLGDNSQSDAWLSVDEIARQLNINERYNVDGSIFYGYSKIEENTLGVTDFLQQEQ